MTTTTDQQPITEDQARAFLNDPLWRLSNLYKIVTKGDDQEDDEGLVVQFKPNRAQRRLLARLWHRNIILKARQLGFCVAPETRVLTADLRWVPIADLKEGDEVVAVDEHPPGGKGQQRRMRTATVHAAASVHRQAYRITFDDGRQVVCTDRHPWLSKKAGDMAEWRSLSGQGNEVVGRLKVGTKVRWITKPWDEPTVEDGWFGGMLDGEGSMAKDCHVAGVNVSQRAGPVWDRLVQYANDRGYTARIEGDAAERPSKHGKVPVPKLAFGRMDEIFRLLGQTRPTRFIGRRFWEGRELPGKRNGDVGWSEITDIEKLGEQTMIDLQTSTGTYIAEGFVSHNTTLVCMLWLDTALFSKTPIRCGIIAQDKEAAEAIFRGKVKFAYDNLPDWLRERMPLSKSTSTELEFGHNGASIRVATSMRSGTIHRLLVSEFGKISAKYPDKAKEVVTGSIPAVPKSGVLVIESTAEGQDGYFYGMSKRAQAQQEKRVDLTAKDYRFHFYPWWDAPEYTLDEDAGDVVISDGLRRYFHELRSKISRELTEGQKRWYAATLASDFADEQPLMWQEFPSFPDEAFQVSTEGCWYATQMATARKQGRVLPTLPVEAVPVNTFWDIGRGDMTTIWLHQRVEPFNRLIGYYEETGEDLAHYAKWLQDQAQERGLVYGVHYLPHEASHRRIGVSRDTNKTIKEMLEGLMPGHRFEVVPRVTTLTSGIQATRSVFNTFQFDETHCAKGIARVSNYRKKWDKTNSRFSDEEVDDDNCHGADSLRQLGQEAAAGNKFRSAGVRSSTGSSGSSSSSFARRRGGRSSGMAV